MTSIRARWTRWLAVLGWAAVLGVLTAQRLAVNAQAPVQRDGAFFLFMAQNIAHGQPAYWATFETKNLGGRTRLGGRLPARARQPELGAGRDGFSPEPDKRLAAIGWRPAA